MSLVSIIIPSYNRASLIGKTIESIQAQSYTNWELLIIDDGSTDDSSMVVEPYLKDNRISFHTRPQSRPAGGNAARNYGFELSKGEYIKWLDSDDLLHPECLRIQKKFLEKGDTDVVFCRSKVFTEDGPGREMNLGNFWHPVFPDSSVPNKEILENFILGRYRFSNNDGLWKKKFLKTPPYNEKLKNSQEWLMIIDALSKDPKINFVDNTLVYIRVHKGQMPSNRSYAAFAANQCYSRYMAFLKLKEQNLLKRPIKIYLLKSMLYYPLKQIQNLEFDSLLKNLSYFFKSLKLIRG